MVARVRNEEGLWVTLTRGNGTVEIDKKWAVDGREANKVALAMLLVNDEHEHGDQLTFTKGKNNSIVR